MAKAKITQTENVRRCRTAFGDTRVFVCRPDDPRLVTLRDERGGWEQGYGMPTYVIVGSGTRDEHLDEMAKRFGLDPVALRRFRDSTYSSIQRPNSAAQSTP